MAQNSFDQLSKQYLEEFLAPLGRVQRQYEIPGEAKFVDVWFIPDPSVVLPGDLGLLGRMAQKPCLFEPYRNVPTRTEVRVSIMKLVWVQEDERRKAQREELSDNELPQLWILAATTSKPLLEEAEGKIKADWMPGVYFLADILKTAIVAIDQLPETEETLWIRILGRDATQERAIREVLALPATHPRRNDILQLLASWKVRIDLGEIENFSGREAIMALSEAFLAWERQAQERWEQQAQGRWEQQAQERIRQEVRQEERQEERRAIALNLLRKQIDLETIAEATGLTIAQIEQLQTDSSRLIE